MANPRLTQSQLVTAYQLLEEIRARLIVLTDGDTDYLWALRRKVAKELTYDERGKSGHRGKLKVTKRIEQNGICPVCEGSLPEKYCVLDRFEAIAGYTVENTRLVCQTCDYQIQKERGYK